MMTSEHARTHAGMVAASSVAVSKQIPLRNPPPVGLSQRLRPSTVSDLPRLFDQDDASYPQRVARLSSAALVYSVNKKSAVQPGRILHRAECDVLEALHRRREGHFDTDRSCPHCRLLYGTLYEGSYADAQRTLPPIAVVNHSAKVNVTFDPETNISKASISNFQVLVPFDVAKDMIRFSHPLHWADVAGAMFRRSDPVDRDGTRGDSLRGDRETVEGRWEVGAANEAFVFEDVMLPINEDLSAVSENIIRIHEFSRSERRVSDAWLSSQSLQYPGPEIALSYKYSLERCVRSNFGVAWEPSGLDVDGGEFNARALPVEALTEDAVEFDEEADSAKIPLWHLTRRDVGEMKAHDDPDADWRLYEGTGFDGKPDHGDAVDAVRGLGLKMQKQSDLGPYYVVNVSASKELHFTIPENSPIELWHILTWTAPAFLFTFLNQAICLAPHVLLKSVRDARGSGGLAHVAE